MEMLQTSSPIAAGELVFRKIHSDMKKPGFTIHFTDDRTIFLG
jgi:hypothetical protein